MDPDQLIADEEERKQMMSILRRLEESEMEDPSGETEEEDEEDDIEGLGLPDLGESLFWPSRSCSKMMSDSRVPELPSEQKVQAQSSCSLTFPLPIEPDLRTL